MLNTVLDIVNEARRRVKASPISANELDQYRGTYELILEDILEERPWIFSIDRIVLNDLTATSDGPDLGYRFKYILPSDTIGVMDLDTGPTNLDYLSISQGLKIGYALDHPSDRAVSYIDNRQFIYSDGILYTDAEPIAVFFRRRVEPSRMPAAFKRLLILSLAAQFERDLNGDPHLISMLNTEIKKQYVKADKIQRQRPADPYLRGIYDWIREFYSQARQRS